MADVSVLEPVIATVAPIFGLILIGLAAARWRYIDQSASRLIIEFVFRVSIPALMFRTMIHATPPDANPLSLWGAYFSAVAVVWLLSAILSLAVLRRPAGDVPSIALGACFGNLVLLGLPLSLNYFGPAAMTPMALIFAIEFPLMWIAATIQFRLIERKQGSGLTRTFTDLIGDIARNPIIVAIFAGSAWRFGGLGLVAPVDRMLDLLGQAAIPASLVALGVSLAAFRIKGQMPTVLVMLVLKLVAFPAVAWVMAFHVFALPPLWAGVVVVFGAMPTGAVAFLFATRVERAVDSVAAAVGLSVGLSLVTVSIVLALLGPDLARVP